MSLLIKIILFFFDNLTRKKIFNHLKKINGTNFDFLIDVGSHKGEYIKDISKEFKIKDIWAFEPNPNVYENLKKNTKNINSIKYFNCALGEENKNSTMFENIESSSSSLNPMNEDSKYFKKKYFFLNLFKLKKKTKKIQIKISKLSDLLEYNKVDKIDLLKIDTEGYEFRVLKSLKSKLSYIKYIHIEHHFDDMIIKNYTLTDIHNYLTENGFTKFYKIKMKFRKSFEYIYENSKK